LYDILYTANWLIMYKTMNEKIGQGDIYSLSLYLYICMT
jgi:hypothetical protein